MFVTEKYHNRIIKEITETYEGRIERLSEDLQQAKDLKIILEKLYPLHTMDSSLFSVSGGTYSLNLPDSVLQYVNDILGGKVIKQEGNKCLVIDKQGNVKTGLTKQKVDKGYKYKLIRE